MISATTVPAAQMKRVLSIAVWTLELPSTAVKLAIDRSNLPKPSTIGLVLVSAPSSSIATG
jgi:hypothetical protein